MNGKSFAPYAVLTLLIAFVVTGCSNAPENQIPTPGKRQPSSGTAVSTAGGGIPGTSSSATSTGQSAAAQQLADLNQQYKIALEQYVKDSTAAKSDKEREKLVYPTHTFAPKFAKLADENPTAPAAEDAVIWLGENDYKKSGTHTIKLIQKRYLGSSKLAPICPKLARDKGETPHKLLRQILAQNPDKCVQGTACLSLARVLKAQKSVEEADKLFQRAIAEYGNYPYLKSGKTIAEAAKTDLYEMHNLSVGSVAPEMEGVDVNGHPMKLSDYRGKIALVDFFGDW